MPASFSTVRQVEFRDTDAAGIMHFASIMATMEEAEHEFLRHANLPLFRDHDGGGQISWPRVSAQCDFKSPARFEDKLDISVGVKRIGRRSVTYQFSLACDGRPIAEGTMTSACCLVHIGEISSVDIPDDTRATLEQYLVPSTDG